MFSLNKDFLMSQSVSLEMSGSLRKLGEYQGKQALLYRSRPQLLKSLKEMAIIQSTESSNRIEGIVVPEARLVAVLEKHQKPSNRSEAEVLGYRNILAHIHTRAEQFSINPKMILKMHNDLYQLTDTKGGRWKTKDNSIEERLPDGSWVTRFTPTSARETPHQMQVLCDEFTKLFVSSSIDKLLLVFAFVFDFLSIHPFVDGNGRISRLITVLLLHQIGIHLPRYISYEKAIEDSKESYYDVLHTCSEHWHDARHRLSPWFEYQVALLLGMYQELETRVDILQQGRGDKTAWVLEVIDHLPDEFCIRDVLSMCPGVSRPMVRYILSQLRNERKLKPIGIGRLAKWRKVNKNK